MNQYYLVRHGQDQDNANGILNGHRNTSLTEIGRQQAKELSTKIKEANISCDAILTSPLKRTIETAEIICQNLNWPQSVVEPLLIERDFGVMTGQPNTKIVEMCSPDIIQTGTITYFLSPPNAETFPDLINRANKLFEKLNLAYSSKNLLLVSHGDFGKMVYAAYYKLNWQDVLRQFHFGNSEMLKLSPDTNPTSAQIIKINQFNN
jgi:broad specificity phosphatase PhoE